MSHRQVGFGLLELLLALALGLMLLAAASQLFGSAYQAWRLQGAAARMQDDARLVLQRLAEDIRMAGMFGCLRFETGDIVDPAVAQAFAKPIVITRDSLTLVGAELPGLLGVADWTVQTDCRSTARVKEGWEPASGDLLALPIRKLTYLLRNGSLMLVTNAQRASLIDNVRALDIALVKAVQGERVDIHLTLFDRQHQLEQQHQLSVAVRNPRGGT